MDNTVNFSETPQPKREYTRRDGVMAWLTVALFACFFDAVLNSNLGLCSSLFMLALYGMSAVYLRKSGVALKNMLFLPVVSVLRSISCVWRFRFRSSMRKTPVVVLVTLKFSSLISV